jgi:hypothetical protein
VLAVYLAFIGHEARRDFLDHKRQDAVRQQQRFTPK